MRRPLRLALLLIALAAGLAVQPGCLTTITIWAAYDPEGQPWTDQRPQHVVDARGAAFWGGFHVELRYEDGTCQRWDVLRPEPPREEPIAPEGDPRALALGERLFDLRGAPGPTPARTVRCNEAHGPLRGEALPVSVHEPDPSAPALRWGPSWPQVLVYERGREIAALGDQRLLEFERPGEPARFYPLRLAFLPLAVAADLAFLPPNVLFALIVVRDLLR